MVQQAVSTVLATLDPNGSLYSVSVTNSVDNLGVNQIGHNFFNIYGASSRFFINQVFVYANHS